MSKRFVVVLGGARSGKSCFAQQIAERISQNVLFVATAEALDEEMRARIAEHRKMRPTTWRTLEAPRNVGQLVEERLGDAEVVLVDCLTLLVSNLLTGGGCERVTAAEIAASIEVRGLLSAAEQAADATFIIVSNEVGLGLVPDNPLGRDYRDILGRINQMVASRADEVYFMAAGIPLKIKG